MRTDVGLSTIPPLGVAVGVGVGAGVGEADALAVGVGEADALAVGVGEADALPVGLGEADAIGVGVGDPGDGVGGLRTLPPGLQLAIAKASTATTENAKILMRSFMVGHFLLRIMKKYDRHRDRCPVIRP